MRFRLTEDDYDIILYFLEEQAAWTKRRMITHDQDTYDIFFRCIRKLMQFAEEEKQKVIEEETK